MSETFELFEDMGTLVVPKDYCHRSCVSYFAEHCSYCDGPQVNYTSCESDRDFCRPSHILHPGEKFKVSVYRQTCPCFLATNSERVTFLTKIGGVLPSVQGLILFWWLKRYDLDRLVGRGKEKKDENEREREWSSLWLVSPDRNERLPKFEDGNLYTLFLWPNERRVDSFHFGPKEAVGSRYYLLSFRLVR